MNSNCRNVILSKSDYTGGPIVLELRTKISKSHSVYFFVVTVKIPKIAWRNPQMPSRLPNSYDLGKNHKQWDRPNTVRKTRSRQRTKYTGTGISVGRYYDTVEVSRYSF